MGLLRQKRVFALPAIKSGDFGLVFRCKTLIPTDSAVFHGGLLWRSDCPSGHPAKLRWRGARVAAAQCFLPVVFLAAGWRREGKFGRLPAIFRAFFDDSLAQFAGFGAPMGRKAL